MTKLEEIENRYKKNEDGSVTKSASEVTSVDKNKGVINLRATTTLVWSEEIEDIHFLIDRVKQLEAVLKDLHWTAQVHTCKEGETDVTFLYCIKKASKILEES